MFMNLTRQAGQDGLIERRVRGDAIPSPRRRLSSSVLKRIQSFTRITKCGVLSLKKKGERKIRRIFGRGRPAIQFEHHRGSSAQRRDHVTLPAAHFFGRKQHPHFGGCRAAQSFVGNVQPQEWRDQFHVGWKDLHIRHACASPATAGKKELSPRPGQACPSSARVAPAQAGLCKSARPALPGRSPSTSVSGHQRLMTSR